MSKFFVALTNPCTENWEEMTPVEKGKFCMQCNKTVVDFTNSPDKEIIRHIKKNKEEDCCGRFREDQLNRWLEGRDIPGTNPALYRFLASLLLLTASQNISAQSSKTAPVEVIMSPFNPGHLQLRTGDRLPANVHISTETTSVFENSKIRMGGMRILSGGKDPMLVVDGASTPLSYLSSIAPEDIASETLLKGATGAAIYGPEGANGVIIINTKHAEAERKNSCEEDKMQPCNDENLFL